jgi:hypothetical protein
MSRLVLLGLFLILAVRVAAAAEASAVGRYVFIAVATGALRLDTETGEVSLCTAGETAPTCTRVSENVRLTIGERARLEAKVAALETSVAALAAQVDAIEAREREEAAATEATTLRRVKILSDRMMSHFIGMVREIRGDRRDEEL